MLIAMAAGIIILALMIATVARPARPAHESKEMPFGGLRYLPSDMVAEQVGPQQPWVGPPLPLRAYPEVNPPSGGFLLRRMGNPRARSRGASNHGTATTKSGASNHGVATLICPRRRTVY